MNSKYPKVVLKNFGIIDPFSIDSYIQNGGFEAFKKALKLNRIDVIDEIKKSGLRGRGGAGFFTGLKQNYTISSCEECTERFVICNADEGEPGTFKDKLIMENDPFVIIEGILISAYAIDATKGFIYIRGEYDKSIQVIQNAIDQAYEKGFLGKKILNTNFSFDIELFLGAGSYLCGEELTLIESLEGKRGYPRIKPPFPAEKGLWNKPTLINNVETFSNIPYIIQNGSEWFSSIGTSESKGTKLFCLSGNIKNTGVYELPFGISLREIVYDIGGGMLPGYEFKGAILGGAAGTFVNDNFIDVPMAFETLKSIGATLGSGAIIVIDQKTNLLKLLINIIEFFKHESCGKCVPCRIGTTLIYNKLKYNKLTENEFNWILEQSEYMARTSLCPLGQSPILPVKSAIKYFKKKLLAYGK